MLCVFVVVIVSVVCGTCVALGVWLIVCICIFVLVLVLYCVLFVFVDYCCVRLYCLFIYNLF